MTESLLQELHILGPAFVAGLLVLSSHVPLGRQVLQRGIIFIDLAVAQAAATGALLGTLFLHAGPDWLHQGVAALSALLMVLGLHALERHLPEIQEALIGASFVVLACAAVLITAADPQGGEHMQNLIAGQILWSSNTQLIWLALATAFALLCVSLCRTPLLRFYVPFAIAITAAVQVVGVYLVFASLIFPALACRQLSGRMAVIAAIAVGASGYALGLIISLYQDLPSGPSIVISMAICALVAGSARTFAVLPRLLYNRQRP